MGEVVKLTQAPTPSAADAAAFLETLWPEMPGGQYLLVWTKDQADKKRSYWVQDPAEAVTLSTAQAAVNDVYFGCCLSPTDNGKHRRCPDQDVSALPALWVDIDIAGDGHQAKEYPPTLEGALSLLNVGGQFSPTMVVHSGGGIHAWWVLHEPWLLTDSTSREKAAALVRRLQFSIKLAAEDKGWCVDNTADLARVLRIPGTLNHKGAPRPVRLLTSADLSGVSWLAAGLGSKHDPDELADYLPEDPGEHRLTGEAVTVLGSGLVLDAQAQPPREKLEALRANEPTFAETWHHDRPDLTDQSASSYDMALANFAAAAGWTDQEIANAIITFRRRHDLEPQKALRPDYIARTVLKARREDGLGGAAQEILLLARGGKADTDLLSEIPVMAVSADPSELADLRSRLNKLRPHLNLKKLYRDIATEQATHKQRTTGRPLVVVNDHQERDIVKAVVEGMAAQNDPPTLFVRAGGLCRIRRDEHGRPFIEPLAEKSLRYEIAERIDCYRENRDGLKDSTLPAHFVADVLNVGDWPFPPLVGVTEIPVLRPNGTVLDRPGYDEGTALLYAPARGMQPPAIPSRPTKADAEQAAGFILGELLPEFRFDGDASRANAVAALLTPIIRQALGEGLAPMAVIDAPQAGTGKTLLAKIIGQVATGRALSLHPGPKDQNEWDKLITSILLSGATVICFDNVDGAIDSPSLDRALTANIYGGRILGKTENININFRASWMLTANNATLRGDLPRRCYRIHLDARSARPETREFKRTDLERWAADNRSQIITALLIMARAWFVAGKPQATSPRKAGFDAWVDMAGGVLAYAGITGFLANERELYREADVVGEQWENFLLAIWTHHQGGQESEPWVTNALRSSLVPLEGQHSPIIAALPDQLAEAYEANPMALTRRVGLAFRSKKNRRFGDAGLYIDEGPRDANSNTKTWVVRVSNPAALTPPEPDQASG